MCPREGRVRAWSFKEWAHYPVDVPLESALVRDFDALLLPGGVMNPDALRIQKKAVDVRERIFRNGKAGGGDLSRAVDTYGICIVDGEPIDEGRLEAVPWTPYCRKHAELG